MFDHNYLLQLIANHIEENPELEYKAAGALQRDDKKVMEITKDVSAFANSNGGVLIYGLTEDKHLPGCIDPVDRNVIKKEWLEQVINSKIRPRIHGLKIHVVAIPENQDHVVYILEIPKGETAHQADDKRYYRRHNFIVEPLHDHEIRDIMGRQKNPEIQIDFDLTWKNVYSAPASDEKKPCFYLLNVYANNAGKVYAKYINVVLTLPQKCLQINAFDRNNQNAEEINADNKVRDLVAPNAERYQRTLTIAKPPEYGPARYEPVLPGMRMLIKSIPIHEYSTDAGNELTWIMYGDNSEPKTGMIAFGNIKRL
jgi:hypothetical protein